MPNWCSTDIYIWPCSNANYNKAKSGLKRLYKLLSEWSSKEYHKSDFGESWLGNLVLASGITKSDPEEGEYLDENGEEIKCRGWIEDLEMDEDIVGDRSIPCIRIQTETAWGPMVKLFKLILDKYYPEGRIVYSAVEPGCGVYETNDENLKGKTYLNTGDVINENVSEKEIMEYAKEEFGEDYDEPIGKAIAKLQEERDYEIEQWEYVPLEEQM